MRNLFKNSNKTFLASIPSLGDVFEIDELEPHIRFAESRYAKKLISAAQYDTLITKLYNNTLNEPEQELVERLRQPIARLAVLYHIPEANLSMTGNGILVKKTETAVPASQFRIEELMRSHRLQAYQLFDDVVEWLEDNTATFVDYASSTERSTRTNGILITPAQFQKAYGFQVSSVVFYIIQDWIRRTELNVLRKAVGDAFYADLIAESQKEAAGDAIDTNYTTVLRLSQESMAHWAMINAIPELSINIDHDGISILDNTYNNHTKNNRRQVGNEVITERSHHAELEANDRLSDLLATLNAEASDAKFANFFNSDHYEDPSMDSEDWRDSDDLDGAYIGL